MYLCYVSMLCIQLCHLLMLEASKFHGGGIQGAKHTCSAQAAAAKQQSPWSRRPVIASAETATVEAVTSERGEK